MTLARPRAGLPRSATGAPLSYRPAAGRTLQFALAAISLSCAPLSAETAFVTDRLLLGVHESNSLDSAVLRLLESGDAVEVLERDGELARVRTSRGREGWVDGRYLSEVAPAAARLEAAEDQARTSTKELEAIKGRVAELEATGEQQRQSLAEATAEVRRLEAEFAKAETRGGDAERGLGEATGQIAELRSQLEGAQKSQQETAARLDSAKAALEVALERADVAEQSSDATESTVRELGASARRRAQAAEQAAVEAQTRAREAQEAQLALASERDELARALRAAEAAAAQPPATPAVDASRPAIDTQRAISEHTSTATPMPQWLQSGPAAPLAPYLYGYVGILYWPPWQWVLLGCSLLLSAAAGAWLVDWRSRRRHGGFRV